jgi:hypothetical protein
MHLMGIDPGTSSIKIYNRDAQSQQCIAMATYPRTALQNGKSVDIALPVNSRQYQKLYQQWKERLNDQLRKISQPDSLPLSLS